jgi:hypothetical protein
MNKDRTGLIVGIVFLMVFLGVLLVVYISKKIKRILQGMKLLLGIYIGKPKCESTSSLSNNT